MDLESYFGNTEEPFFDVINSRLGSSFSMNRLVEISKCDCSRRKPVDGSLFKTPRVCFALISNRRSPFASIFDDASERNQHEVSRRDWQVIFRMFFAWKLCKCWALLTKSKSGNFYRFNSSPLAALHSDLPPWNDSLHQRFSFWLRSNAPP